jgi:hypothetical protein
MHVQRMCLFPIQSLENATIEAASKGEEKTKTNVTTFPQLERHATPGKRISAYALIGPEHPAGSGR